MKLTEGQADIKSLLTVRKLVMIFVIYLVTYLFNSSEYHIRYSFAPYHRITAKVIGKMLSQPHICLFSPLPPLVPSSSYHSYFIFLFLSFPPPKGFIEAHSFRAANLH